MIHSSTLDENIIFCYLFCLNELSVYSAPFECLPVGTLTLPLVAHLTPPLDFAESQVAGWGLKLDSRPGHVEDGCSSLLCQAGRGLITQSQFSETWRQRCVLSDILGPFRVLTIKTFTLKRS